MEKISEYLRFFIKSPLFKGSAVLFTASMIGNVSNYLYTVVMGRMLGPASYGTLTALVSLLYIFSVPSQTLDTVTVRFISHFYAAKNYYHVWRFYAKVTRWLFVWGFCLLLFVYILRQPLATWLNIPSTTLVFLLGLILVFNSLSSLNLDLLMGLQKFTYSAFASVLGVLAKLIFGILLVVLGYSVGGALSGLLVSAIIVYIMALRPVLSYRHAEKQEKTLTRKDFVKYILPTFLTYLGLALILNQDVVLAKRFLSAEDAGYYSALSVIGRIIFFVTGSIIAVMFPLISERASQGREYLGILKGALLMITLGGLSIISLYFFFPNFVVGLLFGEDYYSIAPYTWLLGLVVTFYSLSFALLQFFLAIHKTRSSVFPIIFAILQAFLILFFHASFIQIIIASLVSSLMLLVSLLLFYTVTND